MRAKLELAALVLTAAVVVLGGLSLLPAGVGRQPAAAGQGSPAAGATEGVEPQLLRVRVLASFRHDRSAYTQGLLWDGSDLVESAGGYGESLVRRWRPEIAGAIAEARLPDDVFAEGIALVGERLIQLTWREGVAFVRDRTSLRELDRIAYEGEGWGLCYDGQRLLMSDGSSTLTERDPETMVPLRRIEVTAAGRPLANLNELECAEGSVYANVYGTDRIARIEPGSGAVTAIIDASGLLSPRERVNGSEVLNGIAYESGSQTFYLTGKHWPRLFQVVFEPIATEAGDHRDEGGERS